MKKQGFTLIELLIVVAIIAILAAIAIPNFLNAQVRAKVSRVKADMRTIANSMEMYMVDENSYPSHKVGTGAFPYYVPVCLTSPVAYLSDVDSMFDIFRVQEDTYGDRSKYFRYINYDECVIMTDPNSTEADKLPYTEPAYPTWAPEAGIAHDDWKLARERFGSYKLTSAGPDGVLLTADNIFFLGYEPDTRPFVYGEAYDPTNGTISDGEIIRSPKYMN